MRHLIYADVSMPVGFGFKVGSIVVIVDLYKWDLSRGRSSYGLFHWLHVGPVELHRMMRVQEPYGNPP
jgi:hypothetical protein